MKTTLLIASLVLLVSCGEPSEPAGNPGPDEPVTSTPSDGPQAPDEPDEVTPRPGMADVRAVPWRRAKVRGDRVTLLYWSGVEPCNVLDRVEVEETAESVTITLYEGHDPEAQDVACIELAVEKQTTVVLEAPVAGRKLIDGASK